MTPLKRIGCTRTNNRQSVDVSVLRNLCCLIHVHLLIDQGRHHWSYVDVAARSQQLTATLRGRRDRWRRALGRRGSELLSASPASPHVTGEPAQLYSRNITGTWDVSGKTLFSPEWMTLCQPINRLPCIQRVRLHLVAGT